MKLPDLIRAGVVLITSGDRLKVRGPEEVLTDAVLDEIRARKAELMAALQSACRLCGHPRERQDAASWFCPNCRHWSNADGLPLKAEPRPAVRKLVADLKAAGVAFIVDGGEIRLGLPPKIGADMLSRIDRYGDSEDFLLLVIREAESVFADSSGYVN